MRSRTGPGRTWPQRHRKAGRLPIDRGFHARADYNDPRPFAWLAGGIRASLLPPVRTDFVDSLSRHVIAVKNDVRAKRLAIVVIVMAEMFGTSLWFSVNAVTDSLMHSWQITLVDLGHLTSAVQLGFICGTFLFAISGLADRYSASRIFFVCAVLGAIANAGFANTEGILVHAMALRFATGLALAGIYPIGMKLVMSWAPEKAGEMLGWLVGMLVLGTGLPQFIRGLGITPDWQMVFYSASALAVVAGVAVVLLGDGPHHGQHRQLRWGAVFDALREPRFRSAALGYFGHMWELYAFWAIVPFFVADVGRGIDADITYLAAGFVFLAGGAGCVLGGIVSRRHGSARVAIVALAGSAGMCLIYPWLHDQAYGLVIGGLFVWGFFVVADSPQFSALAAAACSKASVGGALAFMNSIGFAISVISIELVTRSWALHDASVAWILLPGPLFGLWAMRRLWANGYV